MASGQQLLEEESAPKREPQKNKNKKENKRERKRKQSAAGSLGGAPDNNLSARRRRQTVITLTELCKHSSSSLPPSFSLSLSLSPTAFPSLSLSLLVCFSILPSSSRIKIGATSPRSGHSPVGKAAEPPEPGAGVSGFRASVLRVRCGLGWGRWVEWGRQLSPFPLAPSCGFLALSPEQHLVQGQTVTVGPRWGACFL